MYEDINPIRLNITPIQGENTINISFTYTDGNVNITSIDRRYLGDKNTNISVYIGGLPRVSTNVTWRYSPFNLTIVPDKVNFWDIYPLSPTENDIKPFGQTDSGGFWNIDTTELHNDLVDIFVRYNESIENCISDNKFVAYNYTGDKQLNVSISNIANKL
ncbi:hypothetical protein LCGC14_2621140, partial [marine sediment metagenome]